MQDINDFINHPAINHSWLAEQLYGDRSSASKKKISTKLNGLVKFNDTEIKQLIKIKKEFIKKIS